MIDLRLEAEAGLHCLFHTVAVDDGQHAGHGGIHQADLRIGRSARAHSGARKEFGVGGNLGVDLQPEDDFPRAGATLDLLGVGHVVHERFSSATRKKPEARQQTHLHKCLEMDSRFAHVLTTFRMGKRNTR